MSLEVDVASGPERTDACGPVVDEPLEVEAAEVGQTRVGRRDGRRRLSWTRILLLAVLPGLAALLTLTAAWLKWQDPLVRDAELWRAESARAASESTVAMLSYKPDTVGNDLAAAHARLTGAFKDSYTALTHDVVAPGATEKQISAVATVPAAASVSATENHAVVLLFVNQTVVVSNDALTNPCPAFASHSTKSTAPRDDREC